MYSVSINYIYFFRNISHNTAIEVWQNSGVDQFFSAKVIHKNSYEDTATFLIDDQHEFTLDCTDLWISLRGRPVSCTVPDMDITYPMLYNDLRSFMFALHQKEITEITDKYEHFQYEPQKQVFTYTGSDSSHELDPFVNEILSIPDLKKVTDFCTQNEDFLKTRYLCGQSHIVIYIPDKINLQLKNERTTSTNTIDIFTIYEKTWIRLY